MEYQYNRTKHVLLITVKSGVMPTSANNLLLGDNQQQQITQTEEQ